MTNYIDNFTTVKIKKAPFESILDAIEKAKKIYDNDINLMESMFDMFGLTNDIVNYAKLDKDIKNEIRKEYSMMPNSDYVSLLTFLHFDSALSNVYKQIFPKGSEVFAAYFSNKNPLSGDKNYDDFITLFKKFVAIVGKNKADINRLFGGKFLITFSHILRLGETDLHIIPNSIMHDTSRIEYNLGKYALIIHTKITDRTKIVWNPAINTFVLDSDENVLEADDVGFYLNSWDDPEWIIQLRDWDANKNNKFAHLLLDIIEKHRANYLLACAYL